MVSVEKHPLGPRVRVLGVRIHHWHTGAMLVGLGAYLIAWDRRDLLAAVRRTPCDPFEVIGVTTTSQPDGW